MKGGDQALGRKETEPGAVGKSLWWRWSSELTVEKVLTRDLFLRGRTEYRAQVVRSDRWRVSWQVADAKEGGDGRKV